MSTVLIFSSVNEAYKHLKIVDYSTNDINWQKNTGIICLKIIQSHQSYHKILYDGRIIDYVGRGPMHSHGHPGGNQLHSTQVPFFMSVRRCKRFPVLYHNSAGVICLGYYIVDGWSKKLSNEGFAYYSFRLRRVNPQ